MSRKPETKVALCRGRITGACAKASFQAIVVDRVCEIPTRSHGW